MTELSFQERLDKITNDCLDMLEKEVEKEKQNPNRDHIAAVIRNRRSTEDPGRRTSRIQEIDAKSQCFR